MSSSNQNVFNHSDISTLWAQKIIDNLIKTVSHNPEVLNDKATQLEIECRFGFFIDVDGFPRNNFPYETSVLLNDSNDVRFANGLTQNSFENILSLFFKKQAANPELIKHVYSKHRDERDKTGIRRTKDELSGLFSYVNKKNTAKIHFFAGNRGGELGYNTDIPVLDIRLAINTETDVTSHLFGTPVNIRIKERNSFITPLIKYDFTKVTKTKSGKATYELEVELNSSVIAEQLTLMQQIKPNVLLEILCDYCAGMMLLSENLLKVINLDHHITPNEAKTWKEGSTFEANKALTMLFELPEASFLCGTYRLRTADNDEFVN